MCLFTPLTTKAKIFTHLNQLQNQIITIVKKLQNKKL